MRLSEQQKVALYKIYSGIKDDDLKEQTLGGYAGTGKTTLIAKLQKFFPDYAICAYTGKAANVLRTKGMHGASTIHSRIYEPHFENGAVYFDLKLNPNCDGFIVDEASMVGSEIYWDLKSFGLPLIFVGDHGQLEPVESDFNLMADPMYKLEEIHRNAGSIARYAEHLRFGYAARGFKKDTEDKVEFLSNKQVTDDLLMSVDQVICAYNATRCNINKRIRASLGYEEGTVEVGERVMCLKNNRELGLFNGMQGTVLKLYKGKRGANLMDFQFGDTEYRGISLSLKYFGQEKYDNKPMGSKSPMPFDYAYCITCHKAQGDEWDDVLVIEQKCKNWDHRRWAYTAASRARTKLRWKLA